MMCCKACAERFCDELKTAGRTLLLARSPGLRIKPPMRQ
jgi:hypothetical protein